MIAAVRRWAGFLQLVHGEPPAREILRTPDLARQRLRLAALAALKPETPTARAREDLA